MKNFIQHGKALDFVAPSGGVTSGVPVKIGGLLVIPLVDADQTETFTGEVEGVFEVTKVGSQAWAVGDVVFWDNGNTRFTKTDAEGLFRAGVAANIVASGAGDTKGYVRLDGISLVATPAA